MVLCCKLHAVKSASSWTVQFCCFKPAWKRIFLLELGIPLLSLPQHCDRHCALTRDMNGWLRSEQLLFLTQQDRWDTCSEVFHKNECSLRSPIGFFWSRDGAAFSHGRPDGSAGTNCVDACASCRTPNECPHALCSMTFQAIGWHLDSGNLR